jgi:hypothetical protein
MKRIYCVITAVLACSMLAPAQQTAAPEIKSAKASSVAAEHPDLSGIWAYTVSLPGESLKREEEGSVVIKKIDRGLAAGPKAVVPHALPATPAPSYKPELQAKVKNLLDNESKTDGVFYCGKPGIPRIGPPRRIIQLPGEMVFLYEDISGDPYRIIPTDGRPHRADANPTYYGDSVAHWEGDALVVDVTNFVDTSWFGEGGYFHTDAMHVIERLWRDGPNLVYQATVEDPNVLTAPWTMRPKMVKPSTEALEESPPCVEDDSRRLLNNDHHGQR